MSTDQERLQRLEWNVRALAQEAKDQIALFPSFVAVADELAIDYDDACLALLEAGFHFVALERDKLAALDRALEAISGLDFDRYWSSESLRNADEWRAIRLLAREVIDVMAWSSSPPPTGRAIYVGSHT